MTTVPANILAPDGVKPSASAVTINKLEMYCSKFLWLAIYNFDDPMTSFKMADEIAVLQVCQWRKRIVHGL